MKAFYVLLLLVFLASCSAKDITPAEQTSSDIDTAVEEIADELDVLIQEESPSEDAQESAEEPSDHSHDGDDHDHDHDDIWEEVQVSDPQEEISEPEQAFVQPKVVELSTTYNNPAMEVQMNIEYELDSDDKITSISVTSPNYKGMPQFNSGVQAVVGMSVQEASEYYVSGSSLTTPAFQAALKNG